MGNYAGLRIVNSASNYSNLGSDVTTIGDINGDGIDDFAVSQRSGSYYGSGSAYGNVTQGAVHVIFGTTDGPTTVDVATLDGTNGYTIRVSEDSGQYLGSITSISGGHDVNGDGIDDMVVGTGNTYGFYGSGAVYASNGNGTAVVIFGTTATRAADVTTAELKTAGGAVQITDGGRGSLGSVTSVEMIGDMDGDGLGEVIVTLATLARSYNTSGGFTTDPDTGNSYFNGTLVTIDSTTPVEGRSFVVFGATDLAGADGITDPAAEFDVGSLTGANGFVVEAGPISGGGVEGGFGASGGAVVGLGDVNGDGLVDIGGADAGWTVTGFSYDYTYNGNTYTRTGSAITDATSSGFVVFGRDVDGGATGFAGVIDSDSGADQTPAALDNVNVDSGFFNSIYGAGAIATLGDINGDGFDDVGLVTFDAYGGRQIGILFGSATGLPDSASRTLTSTLDIIEGVNRYSETAISAAGDINGDGIGDVLIGLPGADPGGVYGSGYSYATNAGRTYLVFGSASFMGGVSTADLATLGAAGSPIGGYIFEGVGAFHRSGFAVSAAGDLDGDGVGDLIIGAPGARSGGTIETLSAAGEGSAAAAAVVIGTSFSGGAAYVVYGGAGGLAALDALDGVDGVINLDNLDLDLDTGLLPTDISIDNGFFNTRYVTEGNSGVTEVSFTFRREGNLNSALRVTYDISGSFDAADVNGIAIGTGYTVEFAAGSDTAFVTFEIKGDLDIESDETVTLTITGAEDLAAVPNAINLLDTTSTVIITNDDFPPNLFVFGGSALEGNNPDPAQNGRALTFTFTRQGPTDGALVVTYTLAGGPDGVFDLFADSNDVAGGLPQSLTVTFAAGQSTATVSLPIIGDTAIEPREAVTLTITGVSGAGATGLDAAVIGRSATAFIVNDDGRPNFPTGLESDVFGDPHIVTMDELNYDFHAVGEFTLIRSTDADWPLDVQIRTAPVAGSDLVSVTEAMATQVGDAKVEVDGLTGEVRVNGVALDLEALLLAPLFVGGANGGTIYYDGEEVLIQLSTGEGMEVVLFDGFISVCVVLDPSGRPEGSVEGLMGNADGDLSNDFFLSDGTAIPAEAISIVGGVPTLDFDFLYGRGDYAGAGYADSWRVTDAGSLFTYAPGEGTADYTDTSYPRGVLTSASLTEDDRAAAIAAIEAALGIDFETAITNPFLRENAILDYFATGNLDFIESAQSIAADPTAGTAPGDAPVLPETIGIRSGSVAITEGNGGSQIITFTLYRLGDDLSGTSTVGFSIGGDVDGDDVVGALSGSVSFGANERSKLITVTVAGDTAVEADEVLTVSITLPEGVLAGTSSASTTVRNDDAEVVTDEAPDARNDGFNVPEGSFIAENLFNDNGGGVDFDAEGGLTVIAAASAEGAISIGTETTLGGGALTIGADGSISFDAGSAFEYLGNGDLLVLGLSYTVADSAGQTDTAQVSITVTGENEGPVAGNDILTLTEDSTATGDLLANDDDAEKDFLTVTSARLPIGTALAIDGTTDLGGRGAVTIGSDGSISFDTAGDFDDLGAGETEVIRLFYTVSDGNDGTDEASIDITVTGVNDGPDAVADARTLGEDASLSFNLLDNDSDIDGETLLLTAASFGAEAVQIGVAYDLPKGSVTIGADGLLSFSTDGDFAGLKAGETEVVTLSYAISDGQGGTDEATVSLTVTGENDGPVAGNDILSLSEGGSASGNLLGNDRDADGDALSITALRDSAGNTVAIGSPVRVEGLGLVTVTADGAITFLDDGAFDFLGAGQSRTQTLSYTVSDGTDTAEATVNVTVNGVNDAPQAITANLGTVSEDAATVVYSLAGRLIDPDQGDTVTVRNVTASWSGGTLAATFSGGAIRFDPGQLGSVLGAGQSANVTISFLTSDGRVDVANSLNLLVTGANEATTYNTVNGTRGLDFLFGTEGNDVIVSRGGILDIASGRGGADVFFFGSETSNRRFDADVILDFQEGIDSILLSSSRYSVRTFQGYTVLTVGPDNDRVTIYGNGITAADLSIRIGDLDSLS